METTQQTTTNPENYTLVGDYELEKLVITTNTEKKEEIDISQIFLELNLYESIYNQYISGNVVIVDSIGLDIIYALGEGEKIDIIFKTKSVNTPIEYTGIVYKKEVPIKVTEHSGSYVLYFASEEFINSNRYVHYEGYQGSVSDAVKGILEKVKREEKPKELEVKETLGIEHIVLPAINTIESISLCEKLAVSDEKEYGYMFWEDTRKFNFKPIESLYSQDPVIEYNYITGGVFLDSNDVSVENSNDTQSAPTRQSSVKSPQEQAFNSFQEYSHKESLSYLDSIRDGHYGSTWQILNLKEKAMDTIQYKVANTEPDKKLTQYSKILNNGFNENFTDRIEFMVVAGRKPHGNSRYYNELTLLKSETSVINITVPGNSEIMAGQVCNANIPQWNGMNFDPQAEDMQMLSGKFLMAEIRHKLNSSGYVQYIKLLKDSYNKSIG
jgi:hypothetical protein